MNQPPPGPNQHPPDPNQPPQDPTMNRIIAAVQRGRDGDQAGARDDLAAVWDEIGAAGDPLHRCTLAHFLADLQETPEEELRWDERALAAVADLTDERAQQYQASLQVQGLLPSLHLSLADVHRRLANRGEAHRHLTLAREFAPHLPDDQYGALIRYGLDTIAAALAAGSTEPLPSHP
jgi:hypothetical protein